MVEQGYYRHYKGGMYFVRAVSTPFDAFIKRPSDLVAKHTEKETNVHLHWHNGQYVTCYDNEVLVIYNGLDGQMWARPYEMFIESVEHEGKIVPRFELEFETEWIL